MIPKLSDELYGAQGDPVTFAHSDAAEALEARIEKLEALLLRYRTETPLGNQPHMIAGEVDSILNR